MNPPKMPIHIGDYRRDTGHLRAAQHGAYLLLLFHYWSTGALPDDDHQLAAIACMTRSEWKRARPIIERFFKLGWKHPRVDYELEKAAKISEAGREAGKASARSRSAQRNSNDRSTVVEPTLEPLNHRTNKEENSPAGAGPTSSVYAFESGVIRLKQADFDKWKLAFSHLDLAAELIGLTAWAATEKRWFPAVSGALAKKNREIGLRLEQAKNGPEFKWKSGIEGVV